MLTAAALAFGRYFVDSKRGLCRGFYLTFLVAFGAMTLICWLLFSKAFWCSGQPGRAAVCIKSGSFDAERFLLGGMPLIRCTMRPGCVKRIRPCEAPDAIVHRGLRGFRAADWVLRGDR